MENNIIIKIGCDGGDLSITCQIVNGFVFYELVKSEVFDDLHKENKLFINLIDCWSCLKSTYPNWYHLYLVQISTQVTELVKKDYIMAPDKNEYTIDSWLVQLTGRGIGF